MGVLQGTRVQHLILTGAGVQPTVPSPTTLKAGDVGWNNATDLHRGEWAYNQTDDIWYYRQNNTIKAFSTDISGKQNTSEKDASNGYVGMTLFKINFKNVLGTFISFFTNSNTAARTYTYQDRDGIIADDTDITAAKNRSNHTGAQAATTITEDSTHRFTTDTEKSTWNAKVDASYVDAATQGLKWKEEVVAATTANITLSGAQTIDGISVIAGDRVLVKDQTTGSQNGIYIVASGAWSRSTDANTSTKIKNATVPVSQGTVNADKDFVLVTDTITLGTTSLVFTEKGGNVPDATETTKGKVELGDQTENEAAASAGSSSGADHTKVATLRGLFWFWAKVKTVTQTISAIWTFAEETIFSKTARGNVVTASVSGTYTPDGSSANIFELTLVGNTTLANPTNLRAGATYIFILKQDASGGRSVSFGAYFDFLTTTAPSVYLTANAVSIISGVATSTTKILCPSPLAPTLNGHTSNTATYTAGEEDILIVNTTDTTVAVITLPNPPVKAFKEYKIRNTNSLATVTVQPATGTIDGAASVSLAASTGKIHVTWDGVNYQSVS
jgi:hypothetical protein